MEKEGTKVTSLKIDTEFFNVEASLDIEGLVKANVKDE